MRLCPVFADPVTYYSSYQKQICSNSIVEMVIKLMQEVREMQKYTY